MHKSFVSHYHEVSVPENYYKFRKYENLISFAVRLFVLPLTPFHQIAGVLLREELKKNFFSASLRLYLFKTYYANKLGFPIRFLAKKKQIRGSVPRTMGYLKKFYSILF